MAVTDVYKAKRSRRVKRLRIRGVEYAINEWGNSADPLFIYLHGWGDTGSTFQFVVDELEQDWFVHLRGYCPGEGQHVGQHRGLRAT